MDEISNSTNPESHSTEDDYKNSPETESEIDSINHEGNVNQETLSSSNPSLNLSENSSEATSSEVTGTKSAPPLIFSVPGTLDTDIWQQSTEQQKYTSKSSWRFGLIKYIGTQIADIKRPVSDIRLSISDIKGPVQVIEQPIASIEKLISNPEEIIPEQPIEDIEELIPDSKRPSVEIDNEQPKRGIERSITDTKGLIPNFEQPITNIEEPIPDNKHSLTDIVEPIPEIEQPLTEIEEQTLATEEPLTNIQESIPDIKKSIADIGERKLSIEERKLSIEERKLSIEERKLSIEERKLSIGERKLSIEKRKLSIEEPNTKELLMGIEKPVSSVEGIVPDIEQLISDIEESTTDIERASKSYVKRLSSDQERVGSVITIPDECKLPKYTTSVKDRISIFRGKKQIKCLGKIFVQLHESLVEEQNRKEEEHQWYLSNRLSIEKNFKKRKQMLDQAKRDALIVITEGKLFGRELLSIDRGNPWTERIEADILNRYIVISPFETKASSDKVPVDQFVKKVVEEHGTVIFSRSNCVICLKMLTLLKNSNIDNLNLRLDKMGAYGEYVNEYVRKEYTHNLPSNVFFHGLHPDFVKKCFSVIEQSSEDAMIGLFPDTYDLIVIGSTSIGLQAAFITNSDSEKYRLRSSFFVIATPMKHKIPSIPGSQYCFTPDQIFSLPSSPGKTLIYGSSRSAIEYAGLLGSMGFPVTLMVKGKLKNSINEDFDETFNTIIVAGKHMCPAQDINFHDIGVKTCYFNGKIHTNYLDQTTVPTVYSIGDCVYGWPFENYGSVIAAQYLVRRLFTDFDESPEIQISIKSVQTYPHQLAFIGLSEEEARKRYRNVTTYTGSFKSFTNQWFVKNEAPSTLKFVCHMESPEMEKVVGIHFYNEHASNIIQGYSVAMKNGLYYNEVQDLLAICPPSTECVYQFNMERKEYENLEVHEDLQSYIFESNSSLDTRSISSYADSEYASREDFIPAEVSESWKISDEVVPYNSYISEDTGSFKEGSAFIDIEDEEHSVSYIIPYEELNEEQETTPEEEQQIDFINTEKKDAVSEDGTGNDGYEQIESSLCSAYRSKSYTTGTSEAQFMSIYTPSPTEDSYSLEGEAYDYEDFVSRDGCAVKDVIDKNTSDEERDCKKQSSSSEESSNSFHTATCYNSASSVMSEIPSANVTCDPNFERFSAQTLNVSESTSVGLEAEELIDEEMSVEELSEEENRAEEPSSKESSSDESSLTDRILRFDAPGIIVHFCFDLFQDYKEYQYNEDVPLTQQGRCTISSTCPYFSNHGRSILQSPIGSSSLIPLLDGEFCYSTTERNSDLNESSLLHILESERELVESRSYKDINTCDVKLQSLDKSKRRHNSHDMIPPLAPQHDNEEPVCFNAGQSNQFTIDCSDSSGPSDDSIIFVPPPTVQESIPGHEMLRKPSTKYPPRALVKARSISGGEDFTRYVYTSGYRSFTDSDESFSDPESVGAVAGSSTLDNLGSAASIHNNHPIQQSITQNLSFLSTTAQRVLGRWLFPNSLEEDNKSENKN